MNDRSTAPSSDAVRGRFGYVDGLRGVAILGMLIYELHHHGVLAARGVAGHLLDEGSRGLDLFILISGFTLAFPVLTVLRGDGRVGFDLGRYAVRRIARLLPAAWVTIAALAIAPAVVAVIVHPTLASFEGALPPLGATLRECFLLQVPPSAPDAFWVLAVAVRLYVLFPLLLLLWSRSQRTFLAVALGIVILGPFTHLYGFGLGEVPTFMLGVVAADWRVRHFGFARWGLYLFAASAIAGVALETIVSGPLLATASFPADNFGWQAAAFFLLAGVGYAEPVERALAAPWLAIAGSASYALALIIEPVTLGVLPVAHRLSTLGSRALGRSIAFGNGGASKAGRALAPGTPGGSVLDALFVVACIAFTGFLLYRVIDRSVFERDSRMRLADRLEPVLVRLFAAVRTTGVLVLGRPPEDLHFEPTTGGGSDFYAPPPRSDPSDRATLTRRTGTPPDPENELIAAKKRLADRTTAMLADAEYEANRAKGIATAPPATAYPSPQSSLQPDLSGPAYGEQRDVWQKPRSPVPAEPPPPSTSDTVAEDAAADEPGRRGTVVPLRGLPTAAADPQPARSDEIQLFSAVFEKPKGPIRFKIGGEKTPPTSEAAGDGEE